MFIRAVHKSQKKKIKASDKPTFDFLMKELVRCFGEGVKTSDVGYYDEDQEFIRITNDEDLEICIEETQFKNKGKDVLTVEVHVVTGDENSETQSISRSFIAAPLLETTKSDIEDWRVIDKKSPTQSMLAEQEPLLDASQSKILNQEPSIFEDESQSEQDQTMEIEIEHKTPKYTNETQEDVIIDMKFTGKPEELERIQQSVIHQFAPHAGFEIERCEVLTKRAFPVEVEPEENDSILDGSQMSHMSTQLKDEIETLIEEKLKRLSLYKDNECSFAKKNTPKVISSGNYNHGFVSCDNCQKYISGCARFKSLTKYDYDLCETCEATGIHPEPMIKIREPLNHGKGLKLNSHFEYLAGLFKNQPEPLICHRAATTFNTNAQDKITLINNAVKTMRDSVNKCASKMDIEPIAAKPKPTLCHIRKALPKQEEAKVEEKKEAEFTNIFKPAAEEKSAINIDTHPLLQNMSRMFPSVDTRVINEFLHKNVGLSFEEVINKFLDTKL